MQLPSIKRLTLEDLQDAPKGSWKDKLTYFLNLFLSQIYIGLNNGLTPEQNCQEQTTTFKLVGSSTAINNTYQFSTTFSFAPNFVEWWVIPTDGSIKTSAIEITGNYSKSTFFITGIAGLSNNVPYSITIRLWFPFITPKVH